MEFMAALCAGAAVWFLMSDEGRLRALARQFQLDAMNGLLRKALDVDVPPDDPSR